MAVLPGTHGAISARAHTGSAAATPALSGEAFLHQLPNIGQSFAVLRELLQQPALHAKLLPESRQTLFDRRRVLMTLLPGLGPSGSTLHRMGVPLLVFYHSLGFRQALSSCPRLRKGLG